MNLIIKKLVNAIEEIFSEEINNTRHSAKKILSMQNIVSYDERIITDILRELLSYHVWRLCQKTFIYEFHEFRRSLEFPVDPMSSKAFDLYVNLIDKNLIEKWFSKYDFLSKMVTKSIKNTCSYTEEVFSNFSQDIMVLCKQHLVDSGSRLQSIYPLDSDPHNGSKIAICFEFEHSKKVIYKPRSLELDTIINTIFTDIIKFDDLPVASPVAPTINKGKYGWQSFIEESPLEETEICEAYYNLGICAAVFSALGATDLHDENIIFKGTSPYFIDLETTLKPTFDRKINSLHDQMEDILFSSVVATSILPAKLPTIPHHILIGAINTPYPQETNERIFSIKNPGTDAIDIAKQKIIISRSSLPIKLFGNKLVDPLPFQSNFIDGYICGYKKCMSKKKEIISVLSDVQCVVRVIVRPTVQYTLILDACLFPENLIDDIAINKILNYLKPSKIVKNEEIANNILREELNCIKNGDIPYFYIGANSGCICSENISLNSAFDISPKKNAINSLEKLSEKRLTHDIRLIAESYSEIRIHESKYTKVTDLGYQSPFFKNILRQVTKNNPYPLIDLIQSLAIITNSENDEAGWLGGIYGDCTISYDSTNFISMHDTGGILFLLEKLTESGKFENYNVYSNLFEQAKRGLTSLSNELSTQYSQSISIISGESSFDYIFNHKKNRLRKTEQVIEEISSNNIPLGDVFMGPMGVGLLLSTFHGTPRKILEKINNMFNKVSSFEFSKEGIAHGKLGELWAQFRLSYALKNIDKSINIFKETLNLSSDSTGWCNGNAGLLMVLSEMASILNEKLNLYEVANKATVLPKSGPIDLSICHGAAGVLQSLLFSYATSGDQWYLSLANEYWVNVLELANKNGFYTGEKNRDYLLGYYLGWSGVGEAALLLQIFNSGNLSFFSLNLSSDVYQEILFRGDNKCSV